MSRYLTYGGVTDDFVNLEHNSGGAPETANGDYTRRFGGTSAATPVVAGVLGLIYSANPSLTDEQAMEILLTTTDKVDPNGDYDYDGSGPRSYGGWDNEMGYGRVNAYKAVLAAMPSGSHTITGDLTFDDDFTVRPGATIGAASGVTLTMRYGAKLTVEGTLAVNGSVTISGGSVELASGSSLTATSGATLTLTNSAELIVPDNASIPANLTVIASGGTLTIASNKVLTVNGGLTLSGSVSLVGGGIQAASGGLLAISAGSSVDLNTCISVAAGGSMTMGNGSSLTFVWSGLTLPIDGSLTATGATLTRLILEKTNNTGTISLTNCTLTGTVWLSASDTYPRPIVQISGGDIDGRVYLKNWGSGSYIRYVDVHGSSYQGIYLEGTGSESIQSTDPMAT